MKHKSLLRLSLIIAITVICGMSAKAQTWTAPVYKGEMPVAGTAYYVYNIGANGFLVRGGDWGTHCSVAGAPKVNATTQFVTWTMASPSSGVYTFNYTPNGTASNTYMFHAGGWDVWGDAAASSTERNFLIVQTDATNHIVTIQNDAFSGQNKYVGWSTYSQSTNQGTADEVFTDKVSGSDNTKWKFVTQANYDLYNAKVVLDTYMNYAKTKGGIDLTSYIATYNADVTADITTASASLLTALGRTDVSSSILNGGFESGLTSWTNTGSFVTNNWTTPVGFTRNGTLIEKWTGNTGNLGTGAFTQTISGLANGLYGVALNACAVQAGGSNPLHTGAFVLCGNKSTEVKSGGQFLVDNVLVTDGTLTIGYSLQGTVACNWTAFDDMKLYYYGAIVVPVLTPSVSSLRYDNIYTSSTFTVTGLNLSNAISISAPTGITVSPTSLAANPSAATVTVTYDGTTVVDGNITLTSGATVVNIPVKASSNAGCYTPAYSQGNLIADPTFSAVDLTTGGYGGWGGKTLYTKYPYCGRGSAYVLGNCWPDGGSLDRSLTTASGNALKANTIYRLRAMVNSKASSGKNFQFQIEGYNGSSVLSFNIPNTSGWTQFDQTFTTGNTVTEHGIYFNSCSALTPAATDTCFIDNYELYPVPKTYTSTSSLTFIAAGVTKKIAVRASNLASDITITAPSGFSIDKTGMLKSVSGSANDSLTVTFDGPNSASGYVHFISGSVNDSVLVAGTVAPTIVTNVPTLSFDNVFVSSGSIIVSGGNLTQDISISAPSGITVNPTSISKGNGTVSNVSVSITYDKSASLSGNIVLSSGSATNNVTVTATKQTLTDPGTSNLKHLYTFEDGTANDGVFSGKINGVLTGGATVSGGKLNLTANGDYVSMSGAGMAVNTYPAITQEIWFTPSGTNTGYHGLTYFGNTSGGLGYNYLLMQPVRGDNVNRFDISSGTYDSEIGINSTEIDDANLHQLITIARGDSLIMYVDGVKKGSVFNTIPLSTLGTSLAYIAKTGYNDPTWTGSVSKYTIYNKSLGGDEVLYLYDKGANYVPTITGLSADSASLHFSTTAFAKTFNVIAAGLSGNLTLTVPSGITVSGTNVTGSAPTYTILNMNANGTNPVTFTWSKVSNIASGTITLSSTGVTNVTISLNTSDVETSTLSAVTLGTGGALSPSFASATTTYAVKAPIDITSVTVTGSATSSVASISNNGATISAASPSVVLGGTSYNGLNTTSYTFNWGGNYTFTDWSADGSSDASLSIPTVYGWSATPTLSWAAANAAVAGTSRYFDFVNGVNGTNPLYTYNGSNYTGRVLMVRWDGGALTRVYSYPLQLSAGTTYQISAKAAYNSNASDGTLTFRINTAKDNTGTAYGTGGTVALGVVAGVLKDMNLTKINVPVSGVYYLTITSNNGALDAIADLALNTTVSTTFAANVDNTWSNASNWSTASIPLAGDDVTLSTGSLEINANANVNDITVGAGARLTLDNGMNLTTNGILTLNSDNSGTATFVNANSNGSVIAANVKQYLTAGRNWYISIPVTSIDSSALSTAANAILMYDEPTAMFKSPATVSLSPLRGYISTSTKSTGSVSFNGILNDGSKSATLTRTYGVTKSGFNLVGNPYPSYVSWDAVIKSNIDPTIWYRSKNAGNTAYVFDTYNAIGQVGTGLSGEVANSNIPPMQAFWVRVKAPVLAHDTIGTLTFNNSMRSHKGVSDIRMKSPASQNLAQQVLRLQVTNGINSDETIVLFNPNASNGLDAYDSYKMSNGNAAVPEIYTTVGTDNLVINGLNSFVDNTELPLGFYTGTANNFTLKATQLTNFDNVHVVLRDNVLNTEEILTTDAVYTFSSGVTNNTSRFSLLFRVVGTTTQVNSTGSNCVQVKLVDNHILISASELNNPASIAIYNTIGQKVRSIKTHSTETKIDLPAGIYVVNVQVNGTQTNQKIVVD